MSQSEKTSKLTYAQAGVDIKAGEEAVERIKRLARQTFGPEVLSEIGSFGGFYRPNLAGLKKPVLVSSADGVGTKLKLAFMTGRHDTIGEDLVNHCVNDILVHGARGLFFLDYIAVGKLEPAVIADIVAGLSRGCKNAGMALVGGETAEMPDFYTRGEYDVAGFIVGMVDESRIVNGRTITTGDVCIGLASDGLHTNGYSLARKVVFEIARHKPDDYVAELQMTIAEALMQVHRCYGPFIHGLLEKFDIHGMAHITGGGLPGNLNRILPAGLDAEVRRGSWPVLPIFDYLKKRGNLDPTDVYSAFNMGIGFVLVVAATDADAVMNALGAMNEPAYRIGTIVPGNREVKLV
ncbi:phosphoribosylformylglycinamidine cyclo-ligase [candidate division GN15 bacterium]|uniref:Phosphoribosylformylglycinamidine cyclo-ligase n=1 Tax=candidate division GN15 bacterium TaxID=2072418 RepID=A0A855X9R3_9BACT|nr:MAG: phosphoribosylformylglycinamidine cyclo-ligase [candidate division GN15 bacterium]